MYYCSSTQEHWNGFMLQGESLCNVWCQLGGNNMQEGDFVDMHNLNFRLIYTPFNVYIFP